MLYRGPDLLTGVLLLLDRPRQRDLVDGQVSVDPYLAEEETAGGSGTPPRVDHTNGPLWLRWANARGASSTTAFFIITSPSPVGPVPRFDMPKNPS